jgi:hypothetical protein
MRCKECYSEQPRITPLKGAADCLASLRQYVCSICGRVACIDLAGEKRARCFMPFSSLEAAILYLKPAEIISQKLCGIYELIYKRGDKRYKIFRNAEELQKYLKGNPDVKCKKSDPVYISEKYHPVEKNQIKYLNEDERNQYLKEMKNISQIAL